MSDSITGNRRGPCWGEAAGGQLRDCGASGGGWRAGEAPWSRQGTGRASRQHALRSRWHPPFNLSQGPQARVSLGVQPSPPLPEGGWPVLPPLPLLLHQSSGAGSRVSVFVCMQVCKSMYVRTRAVNSGSPRSWWLALLPHPNATLALDTRHGAVCPPPREDQAPGRCLQDEGAQEGQGHHGQTWGQHGDRGHLSHEMQTGRHHLPLVRQ